jgi:hypothetical protein
MSVPDFAHGMEVAKFFSNRPIPATAKPVPVAPTVTQLSSSDHKSFWDNVWDTVNPLEHFPVVSTVYDKITHNHVGDLEKVAGDTLYGGPIGLASSLVNVAFQHITGKSFGDMVMGWVTDDDDSKTETVMADAGKTKTSSATHLDKTAAVPPSIAPLVPSTNDPTRIAIAAPTPLTSNIPTVNNGALITALQRSGASVDLQARALDAYHRTMDLNTPTASATNTVH